MLPPAVVLPQATFDIDTLQAVCERVSETSPGSRLALDSEPLSVTFGVFNGCVLVSFLFPRLQPDFSPTFSHLLPDPTLFETQLCTSEITVVLSSPADSSAFLAKASLVSVFQAGAPLENGRETLKECIKMARRRATDLRSTLQ